MKVFISWSGDLSNKLAETFSKWLPSAIQSVNPYFTPSDIEKGDRWNNDISKELETSDIGILFLTRENLTSPWLIFEAGALSKRLDKSRVCPVLFGINNNDLPGPLRQFQSTEYNKKDFHKLLKTINNASDKTRLTDSVIEEVFNMWWPRLEDKYNKILEEAESSNEDSPLRSKRDILEEILELSRMNLRRVSRSHRISPQAVDSLTESLLEMYNAIQGDIDPQAALNAMNKTRKPIRYLYQKIHGKELLTNDSAVEFLSNKSFEYEPSDDDDIPF